MQVIDMDKTEKILRCMVLFFACLYVLNAVGGIDALKSYVGGRRYLNALWVSLGLYIIVSRGKVDWAFFWEHTQLILPIFMVGIFLYFYHDTTFDLAYFKYAFLLTLACSVVSTIKRFRLREFFLVNSIACLLIFFVAVYQICVLKYVTPDADGNQNIFASMALIIGNISIFSLFSKTHDSRERFFCLICGILAIWVALRTTSRTAYISEGILFFFFLFWGRTRLQWSKKKIIALILFSLFFLLVSLLTSPAITEDKFGVIWNEIQQFLNLKTGETTRSSVGLRLAMWEAAFNDIIPNHLVFGVGDFRKIYWPNLLAGSSMNREFLNPFYHFHNEGVNTLVMGGLLLFSVCNWFLYRLFCIAKTEPVLLSILIGTVSWGMTEVAFFHKGFFFIFVSVWLLYECATRAERQQKD